MSFSKSFPRIVKGSNYPVWEEVSLNDDEEAGVEVKAWEENVSLMKKCLEEAKKILLDKGLEGSSANVVRVGADLFGKCASHNVYHKEAKCKEKFDS